MTNPSVALPELPGWVTKPHIATAMQAYAREHEANVRAELARSARVVPEGFVLVPIEPTFEMISATPNGSTTVGDIYRTMLAAAPTALPAVTPQVADEGRSKLTSPGEIVTAWVVEQWNSEVKNRPLVNIHRARLDEKWRSLLRRLKVDHVALIGPAHEDLAATPPAQTGEVARLARQHCQCPACEGGTIHASDCSVHNMPAFQNGPCDCGAASPALVAEVGEDTKRLDWIERMVCDVSCLGDSARTLRISWNNGADHEFVGPGYSATWREAIDSALATQPAQGVRAAGEHWCALEHGGVFCKVCEAAPTVADRVPLSDEQIKHELDAAKVPDSEDDAYDFQVWRACEVFHGIGAGKTGDGEAAVKPSTDPSRPGPTCAAHFPVHHMDCWVCRDTLNQRVQAARDWDEPWRVGVFISSSRRPKHILMLMVGAENIAFAARHVDFVRWLT